MLQFKYNKVAELRMFDNFARVSQLLRKVLVIMLLCYYVIVPKYGPGYAVCIHGSKA